MNIGWKEGMSMVKKEEINIGRKDWTTWSITEKRKDIRKEDRTIWRKEKKETNKEDNKKVRSRNCNKKKKEQKEILTGGKNENRSQKWSTKGTKNEERLKWKDEKEEITSGWTERSK